LLRKEYEVLVIQFYVFLVRFKCRSFV
jgi:hypothetical protein